MQLMVQAQTTAPAFSPTIKVKALVHSRFEASLTDSIDVQGKYNDDPVSTNFRMRRIELRTDIKLNDQFSGVIRVQLPELKGSSIGKVIELAYMDYKCSDMFSVRAGQFKSPFELDEQTSHEDLRMIDRGPTSVMFVNNYLASYQPGVMIYGTFLKEKMPLTYYLAAINGSNRAVNYDDNAQKNIVGRLEFTPVKGIRIAGNAQQIYTKDTSGLSYGADLSVQRPINEKMRLIVEGEYITGFGTNDFNADTTGLLISDFTMGGFFGQALLRTDINKSWCKTFEIGGKYEHTDPNTTVDDNAFNTITGGIGFIFTPENMARLQLNIVHTDYEKAITDGGLTATNMFLAQFQLKF
jgi:phosphate-selective porin